MQLSDVKKAGIIGCGGAGFPTYFKLQKKVDTLIINGAECEPLLETDKETLRNHIDIIIEGIRVAKEFVNPKNVYLGVKGYYKELIEYLKKNEKGFEVFPLENIYPIGDEHILVEAITGKIIPEAGIPLDVGVVVQNVETIYHLGKLSLENEPFTHRFVTVNGEVEFPFVAYVPIGTPIYTLLEIAKPKILLSNSVIIDGGPMMGKFITENDFIKKTTSGILVIPKDHKLIRQRTRDIEAIKKISRTACIQCRRCTDLCPRYLNGQRIEPHKWMRNLALGEFLPNEMSYLCSECGICELFSCPMDISPRLVAQLMKKEMAKTGIKNEHYHNKPQEKREFSEIRKVNTLRLMEHLDIDKYNVHPHFEKLNIETKMVRIYLNQHIGKPANPNVKINAHVKAGDIVGICDDKVLSVYYHASISGKVFTVENNYIEIENDKNN